MPARNMPCPTFRLLDSGRLPCDERQHHPVLLWWSNGIVLNSERHRARLAAARSGVENRHIRRPGGRNIAGGDSGGQHCAGDEGRGAGTSVPAHHRVGDEVRAGDGEGEPAAPGDRCRWTDSRDRRRWIRDGEGRRVGCEIGLFKVLIFDT